jgi:hypothetical protein
MLQVCCLGGLQGSRYMDGKQFYTRTLSNENSCTTDDIYKIGSPRVQNSVLSFFSQKYYYQKHWYKKKGKVKQTTKVLTAS